jgi:hypothetical protein
MLLALLALASGLQGSLFRKALGSVLPEDRRLLTCTVGELEDAGPGRSVVRPVTFHFYDGSPETPITPDVNARVMESQNKTGLVIHTLIIDDLGHTVEAETQELELGESETVYIGPTEAAFYFAVLDEDGFQAGQYTVEIETSVTYSSQ